MPSDPYIVWTNDSDKASAFEQFQRTTSSYQSINKSNPLTSSVASHRTYLDIESNRSVRPSFDRGDYEAFRPNEMSHGSKKQNIKMCGEAYKKVGIIRNVIDLMGDFASQGISIVHEDKSVEKFYKEWFKKVNGKERSERFLNNLYRTGNVFIYTSNAKVNNDIVKYLKTRGTDISTKMPTVNKTVIPWRYNFLNPLTIELDKGEVNMFLGRQRFAKTVPKKFVDDMREGNIEETLLNTLPDNIRNAIQGGARKIPLDPARIGAFYYKKDDWEEWADPMILSILDDIIMLEKMRLADLSALDGAISNIRLWTLGDLEHKILPTKAGVDKLRNILASNVGGGTMELVWGPELSYTESNSQVYKFLGSEKYESVLNSIYAGLGVPPTLTGMANNGGGFTNNFISLKTLVERLEYGRQRLLEFWNGEIDKVRRAMGFRKAAHITFDQMNLSDDASEKNLLIQLLDRHIISEETILERFKELPKVERVRLNREDKLRENEKIPPKVGPFHPPEEDDEDDDGGGKKKPGKKVGRPKFKQDSKPRKKRSETPRSNPGVAELFLTASEAFETVSQVVGSAYLSHVDVNNFRSLTKAQISELEELKLRTFTNLDFSETVTEKQVKASVLSNRKSPKAFVELLEANNISLDFMSVNDYKKAVVANWVEFKSMT